MHPEDAQRIAEMQEAVAADLAERERAKLAPIERRKRERAAQRHARAEVAAAVATEFAELDVVLQSTGGRPSVLDVHGVRELFERANAAGCAAPELAGIFNVSQRTIREWRSQA